MKYFTDTFTVVEAPHRAGAFDKLQDYYLSPEIGDIFTAFLIEDCDAEGMINIVMCENGSVYKFDPNEIEGKIK